MSSVAPIEGFVTFISSGIAAGSSVAVNPNGTVNGLGTVIGIGQAGQSVVALATAGSAFTAIPVAGAVLNAAGAYQSIADIFDSVNAGNPVSGSDVANLAGNLVGLAGNIAGFVVIGAAEGTAAAAVGWLIVPISIASAAAGGIALVAQATGYTINASGQSTAVSLTPDQLAQASSMTQQANSNAPAVTSALAAVNVSLSNSGEFLVPQYDDSGNLLGSTQQLATETQEVEGGIQYTFANGTTLTEYASPTSAIGGLGDYDSVWSFPVPSPSITVTTLGENSTNGDTGYSGTSLGTAVSAAVANGTSSSGGVGDGTSSSGGGSQAVAVTEAGVGAQLVSTSTVANGTTTLNSTGYDTNGNVSYTEDKTLSDGVIQSDVIDVADGVNLNRIGDGMTINAGAGDNLAINGNENE
ncbi:MAG: hypothetical protein ACRYG5_11265, partial [Janthinobacterium lividum]